VSYRTGCVTSLLTARFIARQAVVVTLKANVVGTLFRTRHKIYASDRVSQNMTKSTLHKLLLARRLYELARENTSAANDISLGIGVNLLQDAVELFLLAVSEYLNVSVKVNMHFDKYVELIDEKIAPKALPFRARLFALNKLRVNSKHYGLVPARSEVEGLVVIVREFFDEVSSSILGLAFATVSLIDLVREGEAKELLREAESAFFRDDFESCLISCRKAIFVRFESQFDVAPFKADEELKGLSRFFNRAPLFARNKEYIEKHVADPTDFIVIDHYYFEMDLMKSGVDSVSFWNVWRLTPEVYRREGDDEWVVKHELHKFEEEGIRERAEYVLDSTINLFVAADQKLAAARSPEYRNYYVTLRQEQVPLYGKADSTSEVIATTASGLTELFVDYSVRALNGNGSFWHVVHYDEDMFLLGFVSEDVVSEKLR
jgi:hypothetical protein